MQFNLYYLMSIKIIVKLRKSDLYKEEVGHIKVEEYENTKNNHYAAQISLDL